eukprot:1255708-Pleurochrysis_carterae.AAC.1
MLCHAKPKGIMVPAPLPHRLALRAKLLAILEQFSERDAVGRETGDLAIGASAAPLLRCNDVIQ